MKYVAKFPTSAIERHFRKEMERLSRDIQDRIMQAVASLQNDPRPFGAKPFTQLKPPIHVYDYVAQYRIRVGDYRILYDVDDHRKIVWIFALRKRNERTY